MQVLGWSGMIGALFGIFLTVITGYDTRGLVEAADVVVQGRVIEARSRWDAAHRRILTESRVRVDAPWKGAPTREVLVRQPGGSVDGIGMRVFGESLLREGSEVVLFLAEIPRQPGLRLAYRVVGMAMGKREVVRAGDKAFVVFGAAGLEIKGQEPAASEPLEALSARVRALVQR